MRVKLKVVPMDIAETFLGFVRINKKYRGNIKNYKLVRIRCLETDKSILRWIRGTTDSTEKIIKIDEDSREILDIGQINTIREFEIVQVRWFNIASWISWIKFYWRHPDRAVALTFKLGIIALFLGVLAILPLIIKGVSKITLNLTP